MDAPGIVRGRLVARQERTEAGCTIMEGESRFYPTLLLLEIGELLAPMKWLVDEGAVDRKRTSSDPLLLGDDTRLGKLGDEVSVYAVPAPMYTTGTIYAFPIWGFYVRPA
jgi:hypothetical protein